MTPQRELAIRRQRRSSIGQGRETMAGRPPLAQGYGPGYGYRQDDDGSDEVRRLRLRLLELSAR